VDAVRWLRERGLIENLPVRDHGAAVSVGVVGHVAVLDLDYAEDSQCETDMNVVMTGRGRFVELQGTAEGETFSEDELAQMVALARKGITGLVAAQKHALELG
jgi:ribonuclease PH